MLKYIKLRPNFHIFLNPVKRYKTSVNFLFSSGGAYFEKSHQKGLTHLLEHSMIKQTRKINKNKLNRLQFEKDIDLNASTSILTLEIFMSSHKDYTDEMLDLILNFAFDPYVDSKVLEQEKRIVLREISQKKGDPNYKLLRIVKESIYKKGSKDLCEVIGDKKIVADSTLDDLKKIHQRIIAESHFLLSVVGGNVNEDNVIKKAEKYAKFLSFEKTHPIDKSAKNYIYDFKYKPIVSELAHENFIIYIAVPCKVNFYNRGIREIVSEVLFSYPEGIFYKKLREKLGLVYNIDYFFDSSLQLLIIILMGESDSVYNLVEESFKIIANPEKYMTSERVNIIKNIFVKRQQIALDNPYTSVEFITNTLLNYGKEQYFEQYVDELKHSRFEDILNYGLEMKHGIGDAFIVAVSKNKEIEKLNFESIMNI